VPFAQIDYLDIPGKKYASKNDRASKLASYTLPQILRLKFGSWDHFRSGKSIKQWIKKDVAPQLKDYIRSSEVKTKRLEGYIRSPEVMEEVRS
jgi:hypothetical protein